MNCNYIINNLHEFIYNELDDMTSKAIREHICTCPHCSAEYVKLKNLLAFNTEKINTIKNSMILPKNLSKKIHKKLNSKSKFNKNYIIAASLFFIFLTVVPSVTAYLSTTKSLDKYLVVDKELVQILNSGKSSVLNKSCTISNIKFTIDAIIKEKNYITMLYSVKLLNSKDCNFALPSKLHIQDEFGFKGDISTSSGTFQTISKDNEIKYICSFKKPSIISNKLKIKITCFNKGLYKKNQNNESGYKKINNAYGNWQIELNLP